MDDDTAVLICIGPADVEGLAVRVARHVPPGRRLVLLYVIDTGPERHLDQLGHRMRAGHRHHPDRMTASEGDAAQAMLESVRAQLVAQGYDGARISQRVEVGEPGREIVRVAAEAELRVGLVLIRASYRHGPGPAVGPKSVSPAARFVLDHSPRDVLLLRV